jgi:hypothetical protein
MKLNRSHALLLVGTLAAGACVTEVSDDDGAPGGAGSGAKGGTGGAATGGVSGQATGGKSGGGGKGGAAGANDAGASTSEGGMAGSIVEGGGEGGGSAQGGQAPVAGAGGEGGEHGACYDGAADEVTCDALNTTGCDIKDFLDAKCAMTSTNMKPGVSNAARNCMLALTPTELCDDALNTYHCVDQALRGACPDATAKPSCDQILAFPACSGKTDVTAETCEAYLSGLTDAGRTQMVTCMEGYCDLYSCSESLN